MRVPMRTAYVAFQAKLLLPRWLRVGAKTWVEAREIAAPRARLITGFVNTVGHRIAEGKSATIAAFKHMGTLPGSKSEWDVWYGHEHGECHEYYEFAGKYMPQHSIGPYSSSPTARLFCKSTGVWGGKCFLFHRRRYLSYIEEKRRIESY